MDPPKFKNLTLDVVDGAIAIITLRREFSANSLHPDLLIVSLLVPYHHPRAENSNTCGYQRNGLLL
jgi:hypothetical protein